MVAAAMVEVKDPPSDDSRHGASATVEPMRRVALVLALVGLVAACNDATDDADDTVSPPPAVSVPVQVTGTLEQVGDTWALCPGAVTPCWLVTDDGGLDLAAGPVTAVGDWAQDTIALQQVGPAPTPSPDPADFPNPCPEMTEQGAVFDRTDPTADDEVAELITGMGDQYAGSWIAQPGPVLVIAVTEAGSEHRATVEAADLTGVCIAEGGFERPYSELVSAQEQLADELVSWADTGWVGLSVGINTLENRIDVYFDEIDPRLRNQIDGTWGDLVEVFAAVEVLEGTVDALERPVPPEEIEIATQPRQAGGMQAVGEFVLQHDPDGDCVYFEADNGRVKPIWPFGTRALRDPVRVIDGRNQIIALAGEEIELGGGFGQLLPDSDDPTDCGADLVWVVAPPDGGLARG